jgi:serine/threonine-protein kinase
MQRQQNEEAKASPIHSGSNAPEKVTLSARYIGLQFHAAGGLGEVYRAIDENLRRDVAIKFIQQRYAGNPEYLELFGLEAEITSRLDHPGVVPVYGAGRTADNRPFYAMRYIEGKPLRDAIGEYHSGGQHPRELHRLLNHLVAVCNTVAYAHNRGVVHCDIKPENIMLGRFGETLVVDWGLATTVERDERARASGEKTMRVKSGGNSSGKSSGGTAGTVGYMSPEQHPGFLKPIGPASDIYSLGATLYCILTGQAPYQGAEETLLLDQIRFGEFPPPREVCPRVPRALEAICLKAMAPHPAERYTTALNLAGDMEAWLADEPVSVYRGSMVERLLRWGRQNKTWVISGLLATMLVLLVSTGAALMLGQTAKRESKARADAVAASKAAEAARHHAVTAQQSGMRLAARFAAQAVANEIERRRQTLLEVARNSDLKRLVAAVEDKSNESPARQELQRWLDARKQADAPTADSWFVTDAQGIQLARSPLSVRSLFVNFSQRNYFHGGSRDLEAPSNAAEVKPIASPHLSTVYRSTASNSLKVAFTVPIWKNDELQRSCLGVLGMSVELGEFAELQTGLDAEQIAVLVDTREDQVESEVGTGLILHHPSLQDAQSRRAAQGDKAMFRVAPAMLETMRQLINAGPAGEVRDAFVEKYADPVAPAGSPPVMAAIAPVRIERRGEAPDNTGWFVIVQESPLASE